MGINDWKNSVFGYLRDSGHKNPKSFMSRNEDLLNYFYIKKVPPEEVNLFFGDKMKNLSTAEYLEILRAKRASASAGEGSNYADSMVFYKGKALGRCPAGTTRVGKTCAPSSAPTTPARGYSQQDLGGLSRAQVQALSKAQSTQDIINAHKKSNKQ